ncbi:MAG TPA: DUF1350 family protein [Polyangiaceae bacterium]|nr:DUF1350 family protein [Polyangiaceae bacterium]
MTARASYERIGGAWVAKNPEGKGVIEFYGGAFFELWPQLFYAEYLQGLFDAGYHIVGVPFAFSFDHTNIAVDLVHRRRQISRALGFPRSSREFPHFWVGHSVGCKIISLLQILLGGTGPSGNAAQPALLLAPDISDTGSAVPWPISWALDALGLGVKPTESQTKTILFGRTDVLALAGLISFANDTIAGNAAGTLPKRGDSSVKWFIETLAGRLSPERASRFVHAELPGGHLTPLGFELGGRPRAVARVLGRKMLRTNGCRASAIGPLVAQSLLLLEELRSQIAIG